MARSTSYTLGDELDTFIAELVASGEYSSASEVVRDALKVKLEQRRKEKWVLDALDHALANGKRRTSAEAWARVDKAVAASTRRKTTPR
ncbi:MAG: Bacterial antitoxin of ParD toxin-antitoxin type system [Pseudomonadota bacterium]|jgi:antitoxin ParD1/3/4